MFTSSRLFTDGEKYLSPTILRYFEVLQRETLVLFKTFKSIFKKQQHFAETFAHLLCREHFSSCLLKVFLESTKFSCYSLKHVCVINLRIYTDTFKPSSEIWDVPLMRTEILTRVSKYVNKNSSGLTGPRHSVDACSGRILVQSLLPPLEAADSSCSKDREKSLPLL